MDTAAAGLFERNAGLFAARYADAWQTLTTVGRPVTAVDFEDGTPTNINLGESTLYPRPVQEVVRAQLADFAANAEQLVFTNPNHCNLSVVSLKLLQDLRQYVREQGMAAHVKPIPAVDIGFLLVFGVGLGCHVRELIETTPARNVLLIEPVAEFLTHSLGVVDWEEIVRIADEREIALHFVLLDKPEAIVRRIESILRSEGNTFLDGSLFFSHYYSWALKESHRFLQECLKQHYNTTGFFEDELGMMRNTTLNLSNWSFHLFEAKPFLQQDYPAFIVGSGPSLDKDIAHIKKWRDRAIVFSAGTALRPLLSNGIRPDFQIELERNDLIPKLLRQCRDEFGLHDICLIASTTSDVELAELFERRWYFFRAGLSSTDLLSRGAKPLQAVGPLVSNAALAAATTLGFRNVYLFGVDCGQKEGGAHHSKDSLYFQPENLKIEDRIRKRKFDRVVPGNFGGNVRTNWLYDSSRRMLADLVRLHGAKVFNCSDGGRIVGTQPKVAAALDFSAVAPRREAVIRRLESQLTFYEKGELIRGLDFEKYLEACDAFPAAVREAMTEPARGTREGFWHFDKRWNRLIKERDDELLGVTALGAGSVRCMIRLGAFFGTRIADDESRRAFIDFFIGCFEERCDYIARETRDLLTAIRDGRLDFAPLPEPPPELAEAREQLSGFGADGMGAEVLGAAEAPGG